MRFTLFVIGESTLVWFVYRFAFHAGFLRGLRTMHDIVIDEFAKAGYRLEANNVR